MGLENLSDREILVLTCERVEKMQESVARHGIRLRALEQWKWINTGGLGLLGAILKWKA